MITQLTCVRIFPYFYQGCVPCSRYFPYTTGLEKPSSTPIVELNHVGLSEGHVRPRFGVSKHCRGIEHTKACERSLELCSVLYQLFHSPNYVTGTPGQLSSTRFPISGGSDGPEGARFWKGMKGMNSRCKNIVVKKYIKVNEGQPRALVSQYASLQVDVCVDEKCMRKDCAVRHPSIAAKLRLVLW